MEQPDPDIKEVEKSEIHQKLMDEAYELWEKYDIHSKKDFLNKVNEKLGELHFYAVITGNLNYQVENGGFIQWIDNGYSHIIEDLIDFFDKNMRAHKVTAKLLSILEDVANELEWVERGKHIIERDVRDCDYADVFERALEEQLHENLELSDHNYYQINKEVMVILESYFSEKVNSDGKLGEQISAPPVIHP